jgi:predicted RNase H-like HicB family nuclease
MLLPASRSTARRKHKPARRMKVENTRPPLLTVYILKDDSCFMAKCPELDLVTEMDSREEALDAMLEMIKDYVRDYRARMEVFLKSPNRAHHKPYINALSACRAKWDLLELVNVKYGHLQLQSAT